MVRIRGTRYRRLLGIGDISTPALRDPCHDEFVHVWTPGLVEPSALKPLLEDQMLVPRDHPDGLHQGLCPLASIGRSFSRLPVCEITASVQLAAWTSMPMYRSIGVSSRWASLNRQLDDVR